MFSFSRTITKFAEKASPIVRNKNWLPCAIVNRQKWRDLKEFKKTSEEIPKTAIENQEKEEEKHETEINQENNLPKEEVSRLERFSIRNDSGYGEANSSLEAGLGITTTNSVLKELESLQKQEDSTSCLNITKFELGAALFNQNWLNLQLNEERKKNIKLKNELETTEKKLNDLRKEREKIWEYAKLQEKLVVVENDNYLILKLFLNSAISERDSRPNITVQKWEELWKQITNLTNNIQIDLTKAKNAIADDVENFSVIANNYWESVQKEIIRLRELFCFPLDNKTEKKKKRNWWKMF
ncbi:MAG: hypothetical protein GBAus27B_000472 [Mycoplasmataceae bacterium]|nr:MAG: hypothetical protein GBAus27B_000472 [Mycoplasmataceae bacterium]